MEVMSNYQRRGFSKDICEDTFKKFESDMSNGIELPIEIQREDILNPQEQESIVR